jgi:hypothetical protein
MPGKEFNVERKCGVLSEISQAVLQRCKKKKILPRGLLLGEQAIYHSQSEDQLKDNPATAGRSVNR